MKIITAMFVIFASILVSSCAYGIRYDGPYEGRIIDADTEQPIEGVVVLGTWDREIITPGGATHNYYDAKETVTDKNGDFSLPGLGVLVLSNITPMDVLIFKSGYEYLGLWPWESLKKGLGRRKNIKWEGNIAIIPLKKLTMSERKKQGSPDFSSQIPGEKMKRMLEEINKERAERGLDPYRLGGSK